MQRTNGLYPRRRLRDNSAKKENHVRPISNFECGPLIHIITCQNHEKSHSTSFWAQLPSSFSRQLPDYRTDSDVCMGAENFGCEAWQSCIGCIHSAIKCAAGISPWQQTSFSLKRNFLGIGRRQNESYDITILSSEITPEEMLEEALRLEAKIHRWVSKIRRAENKNPGSCFLAISRVQYFNPNIAAADELGPEEWKTCESSDPCMGFDKNILLLRLAPGCRCSDRRETWAWPYLAPHPRIVQIVCTAGPKLIFSDVSSTDSISDVREWLQSDDMCRNLPFEELQHLCFSITIQARPCSSSSLVLELVFEARQVLLFLNLFLNDISTI